MDQPCDHARTDGPGIPSVTAPCPLWLLAGIYVLYLGLPTTASVPLFAPVDWLHEGERVGAAQILLEGGLPYRDAFFTHGIFPEGIQPLIAFKLFGHSLAADRLFGLLLAPLAYVTAAFYIWKLFPTPGWRVAGLIGFALYPLHVIPRHIVIFWALGFLTAWVYERRPAQLVITGVLTGLAFVTSSVEHACFLLGAVLLFPFAVAAGQIRSGFPRSGPEDGTLGAGLAALWDMMKPVFVGIGLGLLPFLAYLGFTGTAGDFLYTFATRLQFNSYETQAEVYPSLQVMNLTWYLIPLFYAGMTAVILFSLWQGRSSRWTALAPTLLFGLLSYSYATRKYTYWALAVVSFPFIVGIMYVVRAVLTDRAQAAAYGSVRSQVGERVLLSLSGILAGVLLLHALLREWNAKQVIPRVLLPALALLILAATVAAAAGWFRARGWHLAVVAACPLSALILAGWYFNDAKPQLLTVIVKKPRLVKDVRHLMQATADGRDLTRDNPVYVQDQVLSYMKEAAQERKKVMILATGSGMYYFLADARPPGRFPEIVHAQADVSIGEVIEGLERTGAALLVACHDNGQAITGFPMKPRLSRFIRTNYVDSGRRLTSQLLGEHCPFSIWMPRGEGQAAPA